MPLFILTETSAGYALLKATDKKLLEHADLPSEIETAEQVCSLLKLKRFQKFDSAADALEEVSALVESKVTPRLAALLDELKDEKKASLAVADPKLGVAINRLPNISIKPISDGTTLDLFRSIRDHLPSLIPGLLPTDISNMSLGLSHSLSRHKLKFSPDKIDTMIVQAVALLDDLDKELNTYAMRVKEWYGWHFPEMGKIVNDNVAYARVILKMGMRSSAAKADLSEVLPEEIEGAVRAAAEVSMGTEITDEDLENIQALAEQVVGFTEYRQTLSSYLSARMTALAPNLTALVGELVGARLIAHAGSLLTLAKSPASTIQILGAEKALFRALKTKHDTPKYGLIYHASLVGQATGKNKGKIARVLAAKAALGLRADAYANWGIQGEEDTDIIPEEEKAALGLAARGKVERRLAVLEGKPIRTKGTATIAPAAAQQQPSKWDVKEARKYNIDADGLMGDEPAAAVEVETVVPVRVKGEHEVKMVDGESDDEMDDDEISGGPVNGYSSSTVKATSPVKRADGGASPTLSTVSADTPDSPDSPTAQELNWQSSILGNTKEAKRARKVERHERRLALSDSKAAAKKDRDAKIARRLARKDRRIQKEQQDLKRQSRELDVYAEPARQAGLSVTRYRRKLERGEITFLPDGTATAVSKKDLKKERKKAEKLAKGGAVEAGTKRKHEGGDDGERKKKKKDKKAKKEA